MKLLDRMCATARASSRQAAFLALAAGAAAALPGAALAQGIGAPAAAPVLGQAQQSQQSPQRQRKPEQASSGPRISEVAGRYTVLREDGKDTLCMVTLQDTARGGGYYRAQLAPACRDHGVVVFDPVAWTVDRAGHISLQARKGHKIQFHRNEKGDWYRADDKTKPLGLRRL